MSGRGVARRAGPLIILLAAVLLPTAAIAHRPAAALAATSATTLPKTASTTTPTTVVPIQRQLPAPPVTLGLATRQAHTRLSPWLAKLSLAGFALFLLLVAVQIILTRRRRRWTL